MINEHDIEDMLPREIAERLVGQTFGDKVPEAAFPSLIQFMNAVVGETTKICHDAYQDELGDRIKKHFGIPTLSPCILLRKKPLIKKAQMELDLECGK